MYACVFCEDHNQNLVLLSQSYLFISSVRPVSATDVVTAGWHRANQAQPYQTRPGKTTHSSPAASRQLRPACMCPSVQSKLQLRGRQWLSRQSHSPVQEEAFCTWIKRVGLTGMRGHSWGTEPDRQTSRQRGYRKAELNTHSPFMSNQIFCVKFDFA